MTGKHPHAPDPVPQPESIVFCLFLIVVAWMNSHMHTVCSEEWRREPKWTVNLLAASKVHYWRIRLIVRQLDPSALAHGSMVCAVHCLWHSDSDRFTTKEIKSSGNVEQDSWTNRMSNRSRYWHVTCVCCCCHRRWLLLSRSHSHWMFVDDKP